MIPHLKTFATFSLLLNLLLAGIVLGYRDNLMGCHMYVWEEMAAALSPVQRANVEQAMNDMQGDTVEIRKQIDAVRDKLATLLKAEPFDQAAFLAQARHVRELSDQIRQRRAETMAMLAAKMPPEDRAAMAEALRNSHHY